MKRNYNIKHIRHSSVKQQIQVSNTSVNKTKLIQNKTKSIQNKESNYQNRIKQKTINNKNISICINNGFQNKRQRRSIKRSYTSYNVYQQRVQNLNSKIKVKDNLQLDNIDLSIPLCINKFQQLYIPQIKSFTVNHPLYNKKSSQYNPIRTIIKKTKTQSQRQHRRKQLSQSLQTKRQKHFKSIQLKTVQKIVIAEIKQLSQYFSQSCLFNRLAIYSKQTSINSIRIYRQDLQKIINHRYGNDRVISFLQIQYIQDYDSIYKTVIDLLNFSKQQILIFVFMIMNYNKDQLITPEDLINFIGAKKEYSLINQHLMADSNQIINYMYYKKYNGKKIVDLPSLQYKYMNEDGFNLMKWRILNMEKAKKHKNIDGLKRRKKLISMDFHQQLFTLQTERDHIKQLNKDRKLSNYNNLGPFIIDQNEKIEHKYKKSRPLDFAINFQTFKQIFSQGIPKTFIDFLYLYGGIKSPKYYYTPIDGTILNKTNIVFDEFKQQLSVIKVKKRLQLLKVSNYMSSLVYQAITL